MIKYSLTGALQCALAVSIHHQYPHPMMLVMGWCQEFCLDSCKFQQGPWPRQSQTNPDSHRTPIPPSSTSCRYSHHNLSCSCISLTKVQVNNSEWAYITTVDHISPWIIMTQVGIFCISFRCHGLEACVFSRDKQGSVCQWGELDDAHGAVGTMVLLGYY